LVLQRQSEVAGWTRRRPVAPAAASDKGEVGDAAGIRADEGRAANPRFFETTKRTKSTTDKDFPVA
jgi:hypothetical protein